MKMTDKQIYETPTLQVVEVKTGGIMSISDQTATGEGIIWG